jgi:uncharacterized protein (UPF0248 family)
MAAKSESIYEAVSHLAKRIDCPLLDYKLSHQPPSVPGPMRYLFPVGPYATGLWHSGDEIHLVCLTDNSSNIFWEYIAERLEREDLPKHDCIVSAPHDSCTIWLHYCSIPRHFDLATVHAYGFPKFPGSTYIPQVVRQNLSKLHDTWHLSTNLGSDIEEFRNDYQALRSWAEAAGIFSKSFGTLDAESLVWMLFNASFPAGQNEHNEQSVFSDNVQSFVDKYCNSDNIRNVLTPSRLNTYSPPPHNAIDCYATIAFEISTLAHQPNLLNLSPEKYYKKFCERYSAVILITAECWVPKQRESFHSDLINEVSHLPERSQKNGSNLKSFRIWPHAFRPSNDEWIYVVGVQLPQSPNSSPSRSARARASSGTIGKQYLTLDATVGTSAIRVCSAQEAKTLPQRYGMTTSTQGRASADTHPAFPTSQSTSTGNKFPPASQVLSRLRWDPAHASYDYEVGYLDRFEGLMWLPLEQWGKETEDEEFIPEHRIRLFRRAAKGVAGDVVWDREKRICQLG